VRCREFTSVSWSKVGLTRRLPPLDRHRSFLDRRIVAPASGKDAWPRDPLLIPLILGEFWQPLRAKTGGTRQPRFSGRSIRGPQRQGLHAACQCAGFPIRVMRGAGNHI
jgi:hypothetical protein|tara:strand:- start:662 stop:988 length:327 start_codon:yes stop_codon:yes gene_type:complete